MWLRRLEIETVVIVASLAMLFPTLTTAQTRRKSSCESSVLAARAACGAVATAADSRWSGSGKRASARAKKLVVAAKLLVFAKTQTLRALARYKNVPRRRYDEERARVFYCVKIGREADKLFRNVTVLANIVYTNQACNKVQVLSGKSSDEACLAPKHRKVAAACSKCKKAVTRMRRIASSAIGGKHTGDDLLSMAQQNLSDIQEMIAVKKFRSAMIRSRTKKKLIKHIRPLVAEMKVFTKRQKEGEALWQVWNNLNAGDHKLAVENAETPGYSTQSSTQRCLRSIKKMKKACGVRTKTAASPGKKKAADEKCVRTCKLLGTCVAVEESGIVTCEARKDEDCAASELCSETGRCKAINGSCRKAAVKRKECATWKGCSKDGECSYYKGVCVVGDEKDCVRSTGCTRKGKCGFNPKHKPPSNLLNRHCVPRSRRDCLNSQECIEAGECTLKWSSLCMANSNADCQRSVRCKTMGYCSYTNLGCVPSKIFK